MGEALGCGIPVVANAGVGDVARIISEHRVGVLGADAGEAAMAAAHHKLNNLRVILDYNKMQSDDLNSNIMGLEPLAEKWRAFNWQVIEINGHDFQEIGASLDSANQYRLGPTVIIAHTIKGKGIAFAENQPSWHHKSNLKSEDIQNLRDAVKNA
jgi:transketolase